MMRMLLAGPDRTPFKALESFFIENRAAIDWAETAHEALEMLTQTSFDLLVVNEELPDMTCRDLVEKVLFINAMLNFVVLSQLSHDQFHEIYEGLGVLMPLSLTPDRAEAQSLLGHLDLLEHLGNTTRPAEQAPVAKGEPEK